MRRSRQHRRTRAALIGVGVIVVASAVGGWWYYRHRPAPSARTPQIAQSTSPAAPARSAPRNEPDVRRLTQAVVPTRPATPVTSQPVVGATRPATRPASESAHEAAALLPTSGPTSATRSGPPEDSTAARARDDTRTGNAAIEAARKLYDGGKVIEARHELNALLATAQPKPLRDEEANEVRALLARVADETIFARGSTTGDPLVESYTIQPGDVLINIGKKYDVPSEVLATVNGIPDPTRIRAGQRLKVLRGPFNVTIHKSQFRMDVYLQDLYLRSYRVGLGTENGTPEGAWRVKERLPDPTYFPPASATTKRVIPPGDPTNPLGKFWIGLEGIEGDAVGHDGYGIHGTIEPESIGKAVSLGCIRMHNEDVAFLYKLMLPGRSKVTILP